MQQLKLKYSTIGSGILYAGAAVGVSHLVQSTRAGADYGISFILIIIAIHILKYPFFKAGPFYAYHHKKSLIQAYQEYHPIAMVLFLLTTLGTMFTISAAVVAVTAGIVSGLIPGISLIIIQLGLLILIGGILLVGKYASLSKIIQYLVLGLTLAVLICVFGNLSNLSASSLQFKIPNMETAEAWVYLIAFLGWMPAPLDLSTWHSIWKLEENTTTVNWESQFNITFWGTAGLGILFVLLGLIVFGAQSLELDRTAGGFSNQLIKAISNSSGRIGFILAGIAALGAMLSTSLTVIDAIARVWKEVFKVYQKPIKHVYSTTLIITLFGAAILLIGFGENMVSLVEVATILSFLATPILAYLHFKLCPELFQTKWKYGLAIASILVFLLLSIIYIYFKFFTT